MDRFSQILYDLGEEIGGGTKLYIDLNGVCQLNYQDRLKIQLHYDEGKEELTILSFICDVPPGKYREKLLRATLIANGEFPRVGTFGYSERKNQIALFTYLPSEGLTGELALKTLQEFIEKALKWKEAVENGKPLPTSMGSSYRQKGDGGGIFGLK
jgi:Tir chaperone protein (CesT) family